VIRAVLLVRQGVCRRAGVRSLLAAHVLAARASVGGRHEGEGKGDGAVQKQEEEGNHEEFVALLC